MLAALAACGPRVQEFGSALAPPALQDDALVTVDGVQLPLRSWLPAGPPDLVVAALHGFNDYSNAFDAPARWWAARGIATYAIDQRGFGDAPHIGIWGGSAAMAADALALLEALRKRHPGVPLYLLGDSMGGAVALTALADAVPPPADGLVLVAPAVWGGDQLNPVYRASAWLAAHLTPWNLATGSSLRRVPSDNLEMLRALGRDPKVIKRTRLDTVFGLTQLMGDGQAASAAIDGVPVLVLYGSRDEIVPRGPVEAMLVKLPGGRRYVEYAKGYHMLLRDLQAKRVWRDVAAWLRDPTGALPSGEEVLPAAEPDGTLQALRE